MKRRRPLGQHFLSDLDTARQIVRLADLSPGGHVVEIGPGKGVLTHDLIRAAGTLTALEIDPRLCAQLKKKFGGFEQFHLVEADALKFDYSACAPRFQVVSNLPYYAATPILKRLIHYRQYIDNMTLMLQREVAERIVAEPGTRDYGSLTVLVQFHCEAVCLLQVGRQCFHPPPRVDSTVIRLTPRAQPAAEVRDVKTFFNLVQAAFFHKRKTLKNNLKGLNRQFEVDLSKIEQAGIDPTRRAEQLTLGEFAAIANTLEPRHD